MSRITVDLPEPDGPTIATNSPGLTLNETSSSTVRPVLVVGERHAGELERAGELARVGEVLGDLGGLAR